MRGFTEQRPPAESTLPRRCCALPFPTPSSSLVPQRENSAAVAATEAAAFVYTFLLHIRIFCKNFTKFWKL